MESNGWKYGLKGLAGVVRGEVIGHTGRTFVLDNVTADVNVSANGWNLMIESAGRGVSQVSCRERSLATQERRWLYTM